MVIPRGNLIDGDWKLTKSVDAAQKKNAKASNAWARATASAKAPRSRSRGRGPPVTSGTGRRRAARGSPRAAARSTRPVRKRATPMWSPFARRQRSAQRRSSVWCRSAADRTSLDRGCR